METVITEYLGNLRTEAEHLSSENKIITDAPTDNCGLGEAFSPTDLLATSLACCMLTIIGIAANNHGFNIDGTKVKTTKIMVSNPRKVGELLVIFDFPSNMNYSDKEKSIIEKAAMTCPVSRSLHTDLIQNIKFNY